jgi:hypothetical protein
MKLRRAEKVNIFIPEYSIHHRESQELRESQE